PRAAARAAGRRRTLRRCARRGGRRRARRRLAAVGGAAPGRDRELAARGEHRAVLAARRRPRRPARRRTTADRARSAQRGGFAGRDRTRGRAVVSTRVRRSGRFLRGLLPGRADLVAVRRAPGRDLLAGATVAVVALPLALAFGEASGIGAHAGLVTAVLAGAN